MKWVPRFTYNAGTILELSLPQHFWEPEEGPGMGDEDKAASGVPVGYWVTWEQAVAITLRFTDAERVAVMTMVEWMMKNKSTAFLFRFDKLDAATEYSVYLEEPNLKERIKATRDGNAPWVWELRMTLRSSNGTRMHHALPLT